MEINRLKLSGKCYPEQLRNISSPPKQLFIGKSASTNLNQILNGPTLAVVGSRNVTEYGKRTTFQIVSTLAHAGVAIISGLAIGLDAVAHEAALEAGGITVAVLPGPIDRIAPVRHTQLANRIIEQGGALISEYEAGEFAMKQNFVARNRIVAGISQAVLIPEAAEKSGSLHTARFALEQGKDVLAIPGNITSPNSAGTNNLIRSGATPITSAEDVLTALGINPVKKCNKQIKARNHNEQLIVDLMLSGIIDGEELLGRSGLAIREFNQATTMLEIGGQIRSLGANQWTVR